MAQYVTRWVQEGHDLHDLDISFGAMRACRPTGPAASIVFLLAFAGLGAAGGLLLAHVWAAIVHPQSPTTTHAFSLGVAIKVNIYLMYRLFFELSLPETWWGILVLMAGALTAFVTVKTALSVENLKEKLAYHSIENIGIIIGAMGIALMFVGRPLADVEGARIVALVALVASVAHLINHALFKGLLYLATGALEMLTNEEVRLERLGGLHLERYWWIVGSFVVGSLAIVGLPPLNGFVGEWLLLVATRDGLGILSGATMDTPLVVGAVGVLIGALSLLGLAFALTGLCFVEVLGIGVLGPRRTPLQDRLVGPERWRGILAAERYRTLGMPSEVPASVSLAMGSLGLACVLLGLFGTWFATSLARVLGPMVRVDVPPGLSVPTLEWGGTVLLAAATTALVGMAIGVLSGGRRGWMGWRSTQTVRSGVWHGGSPRLESSSPLAGHAPVHMKGRTSGTAWAAIAPVVTEASLTWNTDGALPVSSTSDGVPSRTSAAAGEQPALGPARYKLDATSVVFDGQEYVFSLVTEQDGPRCIRAHRVEVLLDRESYLELAPDRSLPILHVTSLQEISVPLFWDRYRVTEGPLPRVVLEPFRRAWNRVVAGLDRFCAWARQLEEDDDLGLYLGYLLVGTLAVLGLGLWVLR